MYRSTSRLSYLFRDVAQDALKILPSGKTPRPHGRACAIGEVRRSFGRIAFEMHEECVVKRICIVSYSLLFFAGNGFHDRKVADLSQVKFSKIRNPFSKNF